MGNTDPENKKWDWELDDKTESIYKNLCFQIEKVFEHKRECSYKTRERYEDGVKHFAKYLAECYHKKNLNKIKEIHLQGYVEAMQESGYSRSYVTTNLSAVRYFIDAIGNDSKKLPDNRELMVDPRDWEDRVGPDRAWTDLEVTKFVAYAREVGQERYADMADFSALLGLRIHEVCRLDKGHLSQILKEGILSIKGKGGLVRDIPVADLSLVKRLYDKTAKSKKVFIYDGEQTHKVKESASIHI